MLSSVYLDKKISVFYSPREINPLGSYTLKRWFEIVKIGTQSQVREYRELEDESNRYSYKLSVPCCTPSGIFEKRNSNSLTGEFTGVIVLDLDAKDNRLVDIDELKKEMSSNKSVLAIHKSLSGEGLAVYVVLSDKLSIKDYSFVRERFEDLYGVTFDRATSDLARLRFISGDENMYLSETVEAFDEEPAVDFVRKRLVLDIESDDETVNRIGLLVDRVIDDEKIDVTEDYGDWYKCAVSLSHLKDDGRRLFHKLSSLHSEYNYDKCDKLYNEVDKLDVKFKRASFVGYLIKKKINERLANKS